MRWILLGLLFLSGCAGQVSKVTVYNYSGSAVFDLTLEAPNFTRVLGKIDDRESVTVKVRPRGVMSFTLDGGNDRGSVYAAHVGHIDPTRRSHVHMTINHDLSVSTEQTSL